MSRFVLRLLWTEEVVILDTLTGKQFFLVDYEPDLFPQGFGFDLNVNHKLDDASISALKEITDSCNKLSSIFDGAKPRELFSNLLGGAMEGFLTTLPVLVSISLVYLAYVRRDDSKLKILLTILGTCTLLSSDLVSGLYREFVASITSIKSQGEDASVADAFLALLLGYVGKRNKHKAFSSSFLDSLISFGKNRKSFNDTFRYILDLLKNVSDYFGNDYLKNLFSNNDCVLDSRLDKWTKDVVHIITKFQSNELDIDRENFNYCYSLYLISLDMISSVHSKEVGERLRQVITPHVLALRKVLSVFESASFGKNQFRLEPLTIMLVGQPGVGKSMMTFPFLADVLCEVLPDNLKHTLVDNPTDNIYMRKNEHKYWDGYHGQFATVFDDFGQARDFPQNLESEYMDLIRVCNSFPHICHMAALENKGNVEFNSDIVFLTSNMLRLDVHSLVQPEAVFRRFDLCYLVVPKKEYCLSTSLSGTVLERRLDKTKVPSDFLDDIYEFYPYNMLQSHIVGSSIGYHDFVQLAVDVYGQKFKRNRNLQTDLKDRISTKLALKAQSGLFFDADGQCPFEPSVWEPSFYISHLSGILKKSTSFGSGLSSFSDTDSSGILRECVEICKAQSCLGGFASSHIKEFREWFRVKITPLMTFRNLSLVLGGFAAIYAVGSLVSKPSNVGASQSFSGTEPRQKHNIEHVKSRAYSRPIRAQLGNLNVSQVSSTVVKYNLYEIIRVSDNKIIGFLLFLNDRDYIYPNHYLTQFKHAQSESNDKYTPGFYFNNDQIGKTYEISLDEICSASDGHTLSHLDLARSTAPNFVHKHRDITSLFATLNDIKGLSKITCRLVSTLDNSISSVVFDANVTSSVPVRGPDRIVYRVLKGYQYSFATQSGDCGAILFSEHPGPSFGKIIGMHVAGDGYTLGVSSALTRDDLSSQPLQCQMSVDFFDLGLTDKPTHSSGRTVIRPSPLKDSYKESITMPAFLRPRDGVDPMERAISKYAYRDLPTVFSFFDDISSTFSHLFNVGFSNKHLYTRVLNWNETVLGVPNLKYVDPIPRGTSPGYPHNVVLGSKGKTFWFGDGQQVDVVNDRAVALFDKCDSILETLSSGGDYRLYFTDFLKDERRPIDKAMAMKTRLVSGCPIELTLITRKFFSGFAGWIMANRIYNSIAVGINAYSQEWDLLYNRLSEVDGPVICGDFSNFDGSLRPEYLQIIGAHIHDWYADEHIDLRTCIWEYVYKSCHVNGSKLYQWRQGLPSGHPLTTIINSLYNLSAIRYCYNVMLGDKVHSFPFDDHVRCVVYGDDNIIRFSTSVSDFVNPDLIEENFRKIGLSYGVASKDGSSLKFQSLEDVTFLKRSFRHCSLVGRKIAPLDLDVILETPQWTKTGKLWREIALGNVDDALTELSLHDKQLFDTWSKKIIDASRKRLGYCPVEASWSRLRTKALAREFFW